MGVLFEIFPNRSAITTSTRDAGSSRIASLLGEDEPLARRLEQTGARIASGTWPSAEKGRARIEHAVAATLAGMRREARVALADTADSAPELRTERELARALLDVEAGRPACAAVYLERARPTLAHDVALAHILQAQVGLLRDDPPTVAAAAATAIAAVPPADAGRELGVWANLIHAEATLATGDRVTAAERLAWAARAPGYKGLLAVRIDRLRSAAAADAAAAQEFLDRAIARCAHLGARRDLGLCYLSRASIGDQPADVTHGWLARAQQVLAQAGNPGDLQRLRESFRRFGRRPVDRLDDDVAEAMDRMRSDSARLYDVLSAERAALGDRNAAGEAPDSFEALRETEERLLGALERTMVERDRLEQLAAVAQELAAVEGLEELQARAPSLALELCPGGWARLVRMLADGSLDGLASSGVEKGVDQARIARAVREALDGAATRVLDDGGGSARQDSSQPWARGRVVVMPLAPAAARQALIVGRNESGALLSALDVRQLSLYGSLVGAALARARSSAQLHAAGTRDAALLGAIRDGVLALDAEGRVLALNPAGSSLLRIRRDDAMGKRLRDLPGLAALARSLAESPSLIGEVGLPHGDVALRSHPHEGGVVVILRDLATAHTMVHQLVGNSARFTFEDLLGSDPAFVACLEDARRAAAGDSPILIVGESGTGKELLAQAIHNASPRASNPFVGINVAAIPRELLESELFGYEGGAFTGARVGGHAGKFDLRSEEHV